MADNNFSELDLETVQRSQRERMKTAGEAGDTTALMFHYKDIAERYDEFKRLPGWMACREEIASVLHKVVSTSGTRILDCGAGTGQTAEELIKLGFTNTDGLDMSMEMLQVAEKKGVYQHVICDTIDGNHKTDIHDGTYDAVVCGAAFAPGHMDQTCFPELTRISKSGGYIVFQVSCKYMNEWKMFRDGILDAEIKRCITAGLWKEVNKEIRPYWRDEKCVIYTIQVA